MKKILYLLLLLLAAQWMNAESLEDQARTKIIALNSLITQAETQGITTLHEKTTVRTAEIFLDFANWDEANKDINAHLFSQVNRYAQDSTEMANLLPDFERQDVVDMLNASISDLQKLINNETRRLYVPNIDWSEASLEGDQITYEGKPVFLNDYTWKPTTASLLEYHGQLDGFFLAPNHVESEDGKIKSWIMQDAMEKPSGALGFIFLNHKNPPSWAQEKYGPNFKMRTNSYTHYDIDNPGARELQGLLLSSTIPYFKGKKYSELGYMLCNEPHFYVTQTNGKLDWASGPVSDYTIEKFKDSLAVRHETIADLNSLWGTSFASFNDVNISLPIENSLQGTPMWYDWTRFNRERVTSWFSDLRDTIQYYDAEAKVHLKIMPNLWSENKRGHGIDLEELTRLSEIIGNDAGIEHSPMWGGPFEWQEHYAYDWREVCMSFDFMKSVSPSKIMLNTENHFLSTGRSRDLYQDPVHARSTFFLGHSWGLTANQIWFWPREEDGSPRSTEEKGYAGSNIQQPWLTNEIHTSTLDLNTFSDEIMAMQRQQKPIRIFFSETSAINNDEHLDDIFHLYESMVFDGVPIGFVTEGILKEQSAEDWNVVCIYKTEYVTNAEHQALQEYLDKGGIIVMDNVSLKKDEYGRSMENLNQSNGTIYYSSNVEAISLLAFRQITDLIPDVEITESNEYNKNLCLWKYVKDKDGDNILMAINVGNVATELNIELKASEMTYCEDLITGQTVSSTPQLQPKEVFFVKVKDSSMASLKEIQNSALDFNAYPNPTNGELNISVSMACQNLDVEIYNLMGQCVAQSNHHNTQSISLNLESFSPGNYLLKVIGENRIGTEVLSIN